MDDRSLYAAILGVKEPWGVDRCQYINRSTG